MEDLIYAVNYPKDSWRELSDRQFPKMSETEFNEFAESLKSDLTIREIPEYREKQERFIEAAKALSEEYKYDAQIWRSKNGVTAEISLDFAQPTNGKLSRLIGMSDNFGIFLDGKNRDYTISLKCSSFYLCYRGRVMFPELFAE